MIRRGGWRLRSPTSAGGCASCRVGHRWWGCRSLAPLAAYDQGSAARAAGRCLGGGSASDLGRSAIRARRWLVAVAASIVVPTRWDRATARDQRTGCIAARAMPRCGTSNTRESRAARRALRERAADAYRRLGAGRCAASALRRPAIGLACRARCASVSLTCTWARWSVGAGSQILAGIRMLAAHGLVRRVSRGSGMGAPLVAVCRYRHGRETLPRCRRASCVPIAVRAVVVGGGCLPGAVVRCSALAGAYPLACGSVRTERLLPERSLPSPEVVPRAPVRLVRDASDARLRHSPGRETRCGRSSTS